MVATFDTSDLTKPASIQPLRSDTGIQWGSAVMSAEQSGDGYTYIYGVDGKAVNKGMRIARVKGTYIAQPEKWQYLNSSRSSWMYGETEGDTALTGISNEYSVTPFKGNFVVISQDSTEAFSGKVRHGSAATPSEPSDAWMATTRSSGCPKGPRALRRLRGRGQGRRRQVLLLQRSRPSVPGIREPLDHVLQREQLRQQRRL